MSGIALLDPGWTPPVGVRMAFATRAGGVSVGTYDSLNLGLHVGDAAAAVLENRRRLCAALALPREPLWLNHSDSFKQLWMTQWKLDHLLDHCQLFSTSTDVIIPDFVQGLLFILKRTFNM